MRTAKVTLFLLTATLFQTPIVHAANLRSSHANLTASHHARLDVSTRSAAVFRLAMPSGAFPSREHEPLAVNPPARATVLTYLINLFRGLVTAVFSHQIR